MNKQEIIIMIGIPASGKSTYVNKLKDEGYVVVCPDEIRFEIAGDMADQSKNNEVWDLAYRRITDELKSGKNVVLDATNTHSFYRGKLLDRIKGIREEEGLDFDIKAAVKEIDLEEAKKRNLGRDRNVPEHVMERMHKQLKDAPPKEEEGFSAIEYLTDEPKLAINLRRLIKKIALHKNDMTGAVKNVENAYELLDEETKAKIEFPDMLTQDILKNLKRVFSRKFHPDVYKGGNIDMGELNASIDMLMRFAPVRRQQVVGKGSGFDLGDWMHRQPSYRDAYRSQQSRPSEPFKVKYHVVVANYLKIKKLIESFSKDYFSLNFRMRGGIKILDHHDTGFLQDLERYMYNMRISEEDDFAKEPHDKPETVAFFSDDRDYSRSENTIEQKIDKIKEIAAKVNKKMVEMRSKIKDLMDAIDKYPTLISKVEKQTVEDAKDSMNEWLFIKEEIEDINLLHKKYKKIIDFVRKGFDKEKEASFKSKLNKLAFILEGYRIDYKSSLKRDYIFALMKYKHGDDEITDEQYDAIIKEVDKNMSGMSNKQIGGAIKGLKEKTDNKKKEKERKDKQEELELRDDGQLDLFKDSMSKKAQEIPVVGFGEAIKQTFSQFNNNIYYKDPQIYSWLYAIQGSSAGSNVINGASMAAMQQGASILAMEVSSEPTTGGFYQTRTVTTDDGQQLTARVIKVWAVPPEDVKQKVRNTFNRIDEPLINAKAAEYVLVHELAHAGGADEGGAQQAAESYLKSIIPILQPQLN